MAVAALDGGQVTPKVQTGFTVITKDNIDGEGAPGRVQVQLLTRSWARVARSVPTTSP